MGCPSGRRRLCCGLFAMSHQHVVTSQYRDSCSNEHVVPDEQPLGTDVGDEREDDYPETEDDAPRGSLLAASVTFVCAPPVVSGEQDDSITYEHIVPERESRPERRLSGKGHDYVYARITRPAWL